MPRLPPVKGVGANEYLSTSIDSACVPAGACDCPGRCKTAFVSEAEACQWVRFRHVDVRGVRRGSLYVEEKP